ncbi:RagB/SusD family nutrient uptake outer membrane protein [Sphingobacterium prati]|uniref:RagB/SusD family nutrient uptake outer membrane protein n=1 Tax=Sphingobacterium prati TaxID=2737006 RepID=UPI0015573D77|nr:RagB/SusD family nutrient uptake outer membrane protein [Sphingobacterium prati]NPE46823.1 RagB/SusD family nutrient uptake outer membrane protein [Sphingobacterium prati]
MKRKIKNIVVASLVVLASSSCSKILDEYNPSGLTSETVFATPEGFESLVNAAYSYQRWWYGKEEGYSISEMGTDLWMSGAGDTFPDLMKYINLQGNNAALATEWKALYSAVNICNAGIARIDAAGLNESTKGIRLAELRFLRAFYYWHILQTWGGVHLTTTETAGIITTANKTAPAEFYALIESDLLAAIKDLPNTVSDYGRVTNPAARAFLSRVYLSHGKYKEANEYAVSVIKGNYGFELLKNYADLWNMANLKNKEVVYAVNYSTNLALNDISDKILNPLGHNRGSNNGHLLFLMKYDTETGMQRDLANGRPFNRYMPTRFLLDLYPEGDSRYAASFKEVFYSNNPTATVKLGDTAVFATRRAISNTGKPYKIYDRNYIYASDGKVKDQLRYPTLTKFLDPTRPSSNEAQSARDVFAIRFAELYLNAAEAQLNLGNRDSAAHWINIVRTRAAQPGWEEKMKVTPGQVTLDFILDERAREFAGEQIRWFDLKRTGKLVERVKAHNPDIATYIQDYHRVRPIPQAQLDAITNKDEFTQNEGYQ